MSGESDGARGTNYISPSPISLFSRLEDPWDSKDGVTAEGPS